MCVCVKIIRGVAQGVTEDGSVKDGSSTLAGITLFFHAFLTERRAHCVRKFKKESYSGVVWRVFLRGAPSRSPPWSGGKWITKIVLRPIFAPLRPLSGTPGKTRHLAGVRRYSKGTKSSGRRILHLTFIRSQKFAGSITGSHSSCSSSSDKSGFSMASRRSGILSMHACISLRNAVAILPPFALRLPSVRLPSRLHIHHMKHIVFQCVQHPVGIHFEPKDSGRTNVRLYIPCIRKASYCGFYTLPVMCRETTKILPCFLVYPYYHCLRPLHKDILVSMKRHAIPRAQKIFAPSSRSFCFSLCLACGHVVFVDSLSADWLRIKAASANTTPEAIIGELVRAEIARTAQPAMFGE